MLDPLGVLQVGQDRGLFARVARGEEPEEGPADNFVGPVAEQPFRAGVPTLDGIVERGAVDGDVGRVHDGRQVEPRLLGAAVGLGLSHPVRHVPGRGVDRPFLGDRLGTPLEPDVMTVRVAVAVQKLDERFAVGQLGDDGFGLVPVVRVDEVEERAGRQFVGGVPENPRKVFVHPEEVSVRGGDAEQVQGQVEEADQVQFRPPQVGLEVRRHHLDNNPGVGRPGEGVGRQAPLRQTDEVHRDGARVQPGEGVGGVRLEGLLVNLPPVDSAVRRPPRENLAQDAAEAEHIDPPIDPVDFPAGLFRREVRRGSEHRPHQRPGPGRIDRQGAAPPAPVRRVRARRVGRDREERVGLAQHLRQPPVHDLDHPERPDHDVRRLEVAVNHPLAVRVGDGLANLEEDGEEVGQVGRSVRAAAEDLLQRLAAHQPHDEERPVVGGHAQFVDRDDPGVLQPAGDPGLFQKPADDFGLPLVFLQEDLDRGHALELDVPHLVDDAHAPAADHPPDEVPAGRVHRRERVGGGIRTGFDGGPGARIVRRVLAEDVPAAGVRVGLDQVERPRRPGSPPDVGRTRRRGPELDGRQVRIGG